MSRRVVIDANRIFSELIAANHRLLDGELWTGDQALEAGLRTGQSHQKNEVILNEASAWAKVAGRCAVKDPVRCRTANQTCGLPEASSGTHGVLRLRDARHLCPPGITPPQNDRDFEAIFVGLRRQGFARFCTPSL